MKILVTGSNGFLGKNLIPLLLKRGHEIVATVRKIQDIDDLIFEGSINYKVLDLNNIDSSINLFEYLGKPEVLIHLAWSDLDNYNSLKHIENNVLSHYSFVKTLVSLGLTNINILGTCLEYGLCEGELTETHVPDPVVSYSVAKNCLRLFLEQLQHSKIFSLKWIRLFYVYGEGQNSNSLIPQLESAIENNLPEFNMSGGCQIRDFIPVKTAVDYIFEISLQTRITGIINCCTGKPQSVKSFVKEYLQKKNSNIKINLGHFPYSDFEPMNFWGDTTKLFQVINHE